MYARGTKSVPGTNQKGHIVETWRELYCLCRYGHTYSESMDLPGKVPDPARGQLMNKEK